MDMFIKLVSRGCLKLKRDRSCNSTYNAIAQTVAYACIKLGFFR